MGLGADNFYITEDRRPVSDLKFEGAASVNKNEDVVIVIDRSASEALYKDSLETAVREIAASMKDVGRITVVSSGAIPVMEYEGKSEGLLKFSCNALKAAESESCSLDLAMRLAVNSLINAEPKRAVIYITDGKLALDSFTKYGLSDLTAYMNNNSVSFSVVSLRQGAISEELDYMISNTHGKSYYVYRNEGLSGIASDLLSVPNGLYRFSFVSAMPTDMGRNYLPVEIETYMMNRSGRDETGYFAPLQ